MSVDLPLLLLNVKLAIPLEPTRELFIQFLLNGLGLLLRGEL
jgi:hypothetical protein